MKKIFLLFSHKLSEKQIQELHNVWHVDEIYSLPNELQQIWSNVEPDLVSLEILLKPLQNFLKENTKKGDLVLIQGDFGAVYNMVNFAKSLDTVALYATTKREVIEEIINDRNIKKSIFEHRRFREYE